MDKKDIVTKFKLDELAQRLSLLREEKFTGTLTVEFNMKNGGAGGVFVTTKERI